MFSTPTRLGGWKAVARATSTVRPCGYRERGGPEVVPPALRRRARGTLDLGSEPARHEGQCRNQALGFPRCEAEGLTPLGGVSPSP